MDIFYFLAALLVGTAAFGNALPTKSEADAAPNYASVASQIIATNLLKSYIDIDGNQAHSPLGVAVELAVLSEAAGGATYDEFGQVFGYPWARGGLRDSYRRILSSYQARDHASGPAPSFKTWLYIYRNHSAREDFKQALKDHYFVEVKDINRSDYDWSEPNTSPDLDLDGSGGGFDVEATTADSSNSKDVIGFETLKRLSLGDDDDDVDDDANVEVADDSVPSATMLEALETEGDAKKPSKFDRFVDDKQYVEKPVILEEIQRERDEQAQKNQNQNQMAQDGGEAVEEKQAELESPELNESSDAGQVAKEFNKREENPDQTQEREEGDARDELNLEENETVSEDEKLRMAEKPVVPIQEVLDSNEPEKVSIPLQKLETAIHAASQTPGEIMLALESHLSSVRRVFGARSLFNKDDIATALSANSITGRDAGSPTKMLLFNGLYFRGNWANAFRTMPQTDADGRFFFLTAEDATRVPMMEARGQYHVAELEHLDARALCLPYENRKYTMLLLVPNDVEGLHSLIERLQPSDLRALMERAVARPLHVVLPRFEAEETSRSESMLKGLGLRKLFSRDEADLSLLADDDDLHVDEIVQFVSIRVDEGGSSESALSATDIHSRASSTERTEETQAAAATEETFEVNRPFLYFVMDCEEGFVLVSGKIGHPEINDLEEPVEPEEPVLIEVEFEKA